MTTRIPASVQQMLTWQAAHAGALTYSQTDPNRLSSDDAHMLSPTDCSGLIARLMQHFGGVHVGTYTGNECNAGFLVTTSKSNARNGVGMLPGDCILFDWDGGNWDHIAMYAGNGQIWNHGGPGHGPNNWSLSQSVDWAQKVMVRRFIPWENVPTSMPSRYPLSGLRRFRNGDSGPGVEVIQRHLAALGYFTAEVGGHYGPVTVAAVNAWKKQIHWRADGKVGRRAWLRLLNPKPATDRKASK